MPAAPAVPVNCATITVPAATFVPEIAWPTYRPPVVTVVIVSVVPTIYALEKALTATAEALSVLATTVIVVSVASVGAVVPGHAAPVALTA